ncbi:Plasmid stabilization system [Crenothrix polyspora]|uniref:Plasmid stabilization system n=1 Tax=Crenothrix polyspora TaxID=360316 RepID=A0A1R4H3R2_9GAMM|nr:type II toxin-antitoxin system RelE/ParE family toxin [Crenothrix polyspora]SJM90895.1 Plasmid stabilization system [Crenothrix polyspora]
MPQVKISPRARTDLIRLYTFLAEKDERVAIKAIDTIEAAFIPLTHLPMIGRVVEESLRELAIDFGRSGYFALYDFDQDIDTVVILAIRHQRENDYK